MDKRVRDSVDAGLNNLSSFRKGLKTKKKSGARRRWEWEKKVRPCRRSVNNSTLISKKEKADFVGRKRGQSNEKRGIKRNNSVPCKCRGKEHRRRKESRQQSLKRHQNTTYER